MQESDDDSDSSEEIESIPVSEPAVPLEQPKPKATPDSPNRSTWSNSSMKVEQATLKEHKDHNALIAKGQVLKDKINKADVRTERGKAEFREVWRQVASPAFVYSPTTPLWS